MTGSTPRSFSSDFKLFFLRGLVVLLPSVLTLWIVVKAYQFVDTTIAEPINQGIRWSIHALTPHWDVLQREFEPTPEEVELERQRRFRELRGGPTDEETLRSHLRHDKIVAWWEGSWLQIMDLIGILVAITAVYFCGRLLGGLIGRRIYRWLERAITRLPVLKQVYPYVKQVVDFLFGSQDKPIEFKRVVLVEYPRKGVWSMGLLTGAALKSVSSRVGDSVTVFVPSSPPFSGFAISVPRAEVVELPLTVEEALRFIVSGGVLMPAHEMPTPPLEPSSGLIPPPPDPNPRTLPTDQSD